MIEPKTLLMSAEEYHADSSRIGHSSIREYAKSPAAYELNIEKPETTALIVGRLAHALVLDKDMPEKLVVAQWKTRCKSLHKAQGEAPPGHLLVTEAEHMEAHLLASALKRHPEASALVGGCDLREHTIHWTDKRSGLDLKARPDGINTAAAQMLDLKFYRSYSDFLRSALFSSHVNGALTPGLAVTQAGHYTTGAIAAELGEMQYGVILTVKEPEPETGIIWITPRTVRVGAAWCGEMLLEMASCLAGENEFQSPWAKCAQIYDEQDGLHPAIEIDGKLI